MVNQDYLPHVIGITVAELLIVLSLILYLYYKQRSEYYSTNRVSSNQVISSASPTPSLWQSFLIGLPFEAVYRSRYKNYGASILLIVRIVWFLFYLIFGMVFGFIEGGGGIFFTFWNVNTITIYFFFTSIASVLGFIYDPNIKQAPPRWKTIDSVESFYPVEWSPYIQQFGFFIQILLETMGSVALYITIVVFLLLDPFPSFDNLKNHFITTVGYVADLFLSGMITRWEHAIFPMLWLTLYLIYLWPLVASGVFNDWPYFFVETSSPGAIGWYTGLFIAVLLMYAAWYGLSRLKERYTIQIYDNTQNTSANGDADMGHADEEAGVEIGITQQCHSPLPVDEPAPPPLVEEDVTETMILTS